MVKIHARQWENLSQLNFNNIGKVMKSPWKFKQHGESGTWVSDLFPHIAKHVDKALCH